MLIYPELIAKVKGMAAVSKSDVTHNCGNVTTKKHGSEQIMLVAFVGAEGE